MAGQLIYVVGPSGSGKDSIIQALAEQTEVTVMRRVITREPDSIGEDGGRRQIQHELAC